MQRLTEKNDNGFWSLKGVSWEELQEGHKITKRVSEKLYGAMAKLRDYENAGIAPENASELAEREKPLAPQKMLGTVRKTAYECKTCGSDVDEAQNYCPYCGQRLKWEE